MLLKKQFGDTHFQDVWYWGNCSYEHKFTNISPVLGTLNGQQVIFMIGTGPYRGLTGGAPTGPNIYLAYCFPTQIENYQNFRFLDGVPGGNPTWSNDEASAIPLLTNTSAGEISVQWCPFLNKWLMLCFNYYQDWQNPTLNFYKATSLWGPWSKSSDLMNGQDILPWYEFDWWGDNAYGGYLLTDYMVGSTIYWVLSLTKPYSDAPHGFSWYLHDRSIVLVKNDLMNLSWVNIDPIP